MDWKVLSALIVGAVIIITSFLGSNIQVPNFANTGLKDFTHKILGSGKSAEKNILLNSEIHGNAEINFRNAKFLKLTNILSSNIVIGNEKFSLLSSDLSLVGFVGDSNIKTGNKTIFLDGTVSTILINGTSILPQPNSSIPIKGYANYNIASVENIENANHIVLKANSGSLKVNGKDVILKMDGTTSVIDSFSGDIKLGDSIKVSGRINKISVSGNLNVNIE